MEGSQGEAVFESLELNPQLFINNVLNTVDDLVHDAFDYFLQQASSTLRTESTDRSQDLTQGMAVVRREIQSVLDKRLSTWEDYCLKYCFEVPEGFSMPETDEPCDNDLASRDVLCDPGLDAELDSLRNKLTAVVKDTGAINRELRTLEKQSVASGHLRELISEAMQSYNQNFSDQMFQEMATTVSELKTKAGNLKRRRDYAGFGTTEGFYMLHGDSFSLDQKNVYADAKLEDFQEFLVKMKTFNNLKTL